MPNTEELKSTVAQYLARKIFLGNIIFLKMDLTFAYGQLPLSAKTSVQYNFSLIGGKSTGS